MSIDSGGSGFHASWSASVLHGYVHAHIDYARQRFLSHEIKAELIILPQTDNHNASHSAKSPARNSFLHMDEATVACSFDNWHTAPHEDKLLPELLCGAAKLRICNLRCIYLELGSVFRNAYLE